MRRETAVIRLTGEETSRLQEWTRRGKTEQRLVERAGIILLASEGRTNEQIATALKTRTARVSKWRQRFGKNRLEGLGDAARSGKPAKYDAATEKRVLGLLDQSPRKAIRNGTARGWPKLCRVSVRIRFGASCEGTISVYRDGAVGVSVQTRSSVRKRPTWWGFI